MNNKIIKFNNKIIIIIIVFIMMMMINKWIDEINIDNS